MVKHMVRASWLSAFALALSACASNPLDPGVEPPEQDIVDEEGAVIEEATVNPHTDRVILQGALAPGDSFEDQYITGRFVTYAVTVAAGEQLSVTVYPNDDDSTATAYLYGPDLRRGFASLRRVTSAQGSRAAGGARLRQRVTTAGTYLVVVGEAGGGRGQFTISRDAGGSPLTQASVRPTTVRSLPSINHGATGGLSQFDRYLCDSARPHPGPESVYEVRVDEAGILAAELTGSNAGALDVYLLRSLNGTACLDGGVTRAGAWVTPGRYYVVVDSTNGNPAPFSLRVAVTSPATMEGYGMDAEIARQGLQAFDVAFRRREGRRFLYGMIDFSIHSAYRREWIVDLATSELAYNLYVAHGANNELPGERGYAQRFSNRSGSNMSSLGMARTGATYNGTFGYSVRLHGLEVGYNDKLLARSVVIHPWFGSSDRFVQSQHYVAPTWGCPGVDDSLPLSFFDQVANGMFLWSYYPDEDWSLRSKYLR